MILNVNLLAEVVPPVSVRGTEDKAPSVVIVPGELPAAMVCAPPEKMLDPLKRMLNTKLALASDVVVVQMQVEI